MDMLYEDEGGCMNRKAIHLSLLNINHQLPTRTFVVVIYQIIELL